MTAAALTSFTVLLVLAGSGRNRSARTVRPRPGGAELTSDDPPRLSRRSTRRFATAVGVVAAGWLLGPAMAVIVVVGALGWPRLSDVLRQRRHRAAVEASLPDAIEMLILVVRAGMTPHQAVSLLTERAPAPIRPAFVEVERRRARGAPLGDALRALPDLVGPGATVVADTLAMAERYGTPIADALEQLSVDVRERRVRQAEADARKLPIRMSFPLVVCTLPSFVLIAIVPAVLGALSSLGDRGF